MNLCDLSQVRQLLEKYGLKPQKGFGQNFLINPEIPNRIAMSSVIGADWYKYSNACLGDNALEIGPGLGAMTVELCEAYKKVIAVEIDRGMQKVLQETLADHDNVTVVDGDFLKLDLPQFLEENYSGERVKVCANLPYYITSPILMKILESYSPAVQSKVQSITILVQTEVANRLCAKAGSDEYGAITASVNLYGTVEKLFDVSAGNFYPAPKVSSSVVHISLYENGLKDAFNGIPDDIATATKLADFTKKLIAAGFNQRRKTFVNSASSLAPKSIISDCLEKLNIRTDVRAENLSAQDYLNIAKELLNAR